MSFTDINHFSISLSLSYWNITDSTCIRRCIRIDARAVVAWRQTVDSMWLNVHLQNNPYIAHIRSADHVGLTCRPTDRAYVKWPVRNVTTSQKSQNKHFKVLCRRCLQRKNSLQETPGPTGSECFCQEVYNDCFHLCFCDTLTTHPQPAAQCI